MAGKTKEELDIQKREDELLQLATELDARAKELDKREAALMKTAEAVAEKEASVTKRDSEVKTARAAFDADQRKLKADQSTLAAEQKKLADALTSLERAKAAVGNRERAVTEAERLRDTEYADLRAKLEAELTERRRKADLEYERLRATQKSELENELQALKTKLLAEIDKAESQERDRVRRQIAVERDSWDAEHQRSVAALAAEREKLVQAQIALGKEQQDFAKEKSEVEDERARLEDKDKRLEEKWRRRKAKLDGEVAELHAAAIAGYEARLKAAFDDNADLRKAIRVQTELLEGAETLKHMLGDRAPHEVIRELNSKTDEIARLSAELATRPTEEMRRRVSELETEIKNLSAENRRLNANLQEERSHSENGRESEMKFGDLSAELVQVTRQKETLEAEVKGLHAKLQQYLNPEQVPMVRAERVKEMETPLKRKVKSNSSIPGAALFVLQTKHVPWSQRPEANVDEIAWLDGIWASCNDYGIKFNRRLLDAFHTSLKSAEMSPITVLAGVSGTGKSQLPKLYSHFGGIFFESVSVQSNWDSQESMLGYFNSIDNHFDAQPILQFLAQAVHAKDGKYPSLKDYVCMVLLDEMNLAHPELYFAEFLSKLEQRRGDGAMPFIDVKLGSGQLPEPLYLGRNVLWTGTMNQDETTKSLSDKVLDRSNMIFFPRPKTLERRVELKKLNDQNRAKYPMTWKVWAQWLDNGQSLFTEKQIEPFKQILEVINNYLADAGRAIGHRVWQSVETYMSLYPRVRAARAKKNEKLLLAAMHDAFEDQLVLKVMPKLRGIETRGTGEKALNDIQALLKATGFESLDNDFQKARDLGHGQFMWQTAGYLQTKASESASAPEASADAQSAAPKIDVTSAPSAENPSEQPSNPEAADDVPQSVGEVPPRIEKFMERLSAEAKKKGVALSALKRKQIYRVLSPFGCNVPDLDLLEVLCRKGWK